jgi:hypothetical protein
MSKKQLLIGVVMLVVLFGAGYFFSKSALAPSGPNIAISSGDVVVSEEEKYYTIHARYPEEAPARVGEVVGEIITNFKEDTNVENVTEEDAVIQGLGADRKYALDISYKRYASDTTYSLVFTIYQDTLGAHPNTFYRTLTFSDQTEVELGDLFVSGSQYLERLSSLSYEKVVAELTKRTGTSPSDEMLDTVRMGTAPTPETLQFFFIENDTLHLLFPPYQVAAYAAGSFDIAIPQSELIDILK